MSAESLLLLLLFFLRGISGKKRAKCMEQWRRTIKWNLIDK